MLNIVLDNDNAALAEALVQWFAQPTEDPFAADTLIVSQLGVGRWLETQLARRTGIAANLRIELPSRFLWHNVQQIVRGTAERAPFDPLVVRWAVHDALSKLPADPKFEALRVRWQSASISERFALACDLAELFEIYLAYRRDWMARWAANQDVATTSGKTLASATFDAHQPWQRWLWQQILARIGDVASVHPFDEFLRIIKAPPELPSPQASLFDQRGAVIDHDWPAGEQRRYAPRGRVAMFGLLGMPPEQLELFAALAREREFIWFANDPAQGFWEDLVSRKQAARIALESPDEAWLYEAQPAVLGEWGRQQRDFLGAIRNLEAGAGAAVIDDRLRSRETATPVSLLTALQSAIFNLSDEPLCVYLEHSDQALRAHASLQVHSCHSLARQIEVVHDSLLAAFRDIPDLRAEQVAVFCTDPDRTSSLIQAVFGNGGLHDLPVSVSGQQLNGSGQMRAFEAFVHLVQGPAHIADVLQWFGLDAVRRVCKLDDTLLTRLQSVLDQAGARRDDLTSTAQMPKHGWRMAIQRLMLGSFAGTTGVAEPIADVMPVGQMDAALLGALGSLISLLGEVQAMRSARTEPDLHFSPDDREVVRPVRYWVSLLTAWTDRWLAPVDGEREGLYQVRDLLAQLADSMNPLSAALQEQPQPFAVIAQAINRQMRVATAVARPSGAITVAPFGSLRQVPFRVCAVVGLDHGRWPSTWHASEFDLMRAQPRFGDTSAAQRARGCFLDVIQDTADRLILCFSGRDDRSNEVRSPARVVSELVEYVQARHRDARPADPEGNAAMVREHPLQPFAGRRFASDATPSFARPWYAAASALAGADPRREAVGPVVADESAPATVAPMSSAPAINVATLTDAYMNPARYLMRHRAAVSVSRHETETVDIEPLESADLDRFDQPGLVRSIQSMQRQGVAPAQIEQWLHAHPLLPGGAIATGQAAQILFEAQQLQAQTDALLEQFGPGQLCEPAQPAARVSLSRTDQPDVVVSGRLFPLFQLESGSVLQLLPAIGRVTTYAVLQLWHQHWLLCGSDVAADCGVVTVCAVDRIDAGMTQNQLALQTACADRPIALEALGRSVQTYQDICARPYNLFARTAQAWLRTTASLDIQADSGFARERAFDAFAKDKVLFPAESRRPWPLALWRDTPPPFAVVLRDSLSVYGPIWQCVIGKSVPDFAREGADPLGDDGHVDTHLSGL